MVETNNKYMSSPEDTIIVCCARIDMNEHIIYKVRDALKRELDWKYIIEKAHSHGVSSLLYHNLAKIRKFEEKFEVSEEKQRKKYYIIIKYK